MKCSQRIDDFGSQVSFPDEWVNIDTHQPGVPPLFIVNAQVYCIATLHLYHRFHWLLTLFVVASVRFLLNFLHRDHGWRWLVAGAIFSNNFSCCRIFEGLSYCTTSAAVISEVLQRSPRSFQTLCKWCCSKRWCYTYERNVQIWQGS